MKLRSLCFVSSFQYVRIAILKPAYEYQTALGRSKEYPSATLRPRCYHICLPRELSLSLSTCCVLALSCALIPARRRAPVAPSFRQLYRLSEVYPARGINHGEEAW
jgi:hypothetical protein